MDNDELERIVNDVVELDNSFDEDVDDISIADTFNLLRDQLSQNVAPCILETTPNRTALGYTVNTVPDFQPVVRPPILDQELAYCNRCNESVPLEERVIYSEDLDSILCEDCFEDDYFHCIFCRKPKNDRDGTMLWNGNMSCTECIATNCFRCNECTRYFNNVLGIGLSDSEPMFCRECYQNSQMRPVIDSHYTRQYDRTDNFVESGKRAYSCEIECYPKTEQSLIKACTELPKCIGITRDGSLNASSYGKELITPKLSGDIGDKVLQDTCTVLAKHKFWVDSSCGLHIHIDCPEYKSNTAWVKTLLYFYIVFEPVIYSFLPISRRKNRYCLPLTDFYHTREIMKADSVAEIEKIWYREQNVRTIKQIKTGKYTDSRYSGVNMHSLFSNGHLEIRFHSGTVNYEKIREWIDLHVAIVNLVSQYTTGIWTSIEKTKYLVTIKEKQDEFFKLLGHVNLPDHTKKYFLDRQDKFAIVTSKNENVCAE